MNTTIVRKIIQCMLLFAIAIGATWTLEHHGFILGMMFAIAPSYIIVYSEQNVYVPAVDMHNGVREEKMKT